MMQFGEFSHAISLLRRQQKIDRFIVKQSKEHTELLRYNNTPLIELVVDLLSERLELDVEKTSLLFKYIANGCPTHNNDMFNIYQLLTA